MIQWIRYKHRIPGPPRPGGTLSAAEVRQRYGVSQWVVYEWIGKGLLPARRVKPGMPYAITITGATDHALREYIANSSRIGSSYQNRIEQGAI